jgi:hypothetical protein
LEGKQNSWRCVGLGPERRGIRGLQEFDEGAKMADNVHKFAEQVIDLAERLEGMADAAQGKGIRRGRGGTRWLLLPAAGAGLYALVTNNSFGRHAKGMVEQAKTRASELPDDLMGRVRQTSSSRSGSRAKSQSQSRSGSRRSASSRKKSSARRSTAAT